MKALLKWKSFLRVVSFIILNFFIHLQKWRHLAFWMCHKILCITGGYSVLGWNHPGFGGSTVSSIVFCVDVRASVISSFEVGLIDLNLCTQSLEARLASKVCRSGRFWTTINMKRHTSLLISYQFRPNHIEISSWLRNNSPLLFNPGFLGSCFI